MPLTIANTMRLVVVLVLAIGLAGPISGSKGHFDESMGYSVDRFNGRLLQNLSKEDRFRNLFYSPLSIHMALAMILGGANLRSETRAELVKVMNFRGEKEEGLAEYLEDCEEMLKHFGRLSSEASGKGAGNKTRLDIFTRVIASNGVKPKSSYVNYLKSFHSKFSSVSDSGSKQKVIREINEWGKSVGFKSPVLEEDYLDNGFAAVLISAINLQAFWLDGLKEKPGKFPSFGDPRRMKDTPFLHGNDVNGSRYIDFLAPDDGQPKCLVLGGPSKLSAKELYEKQKAKLGHLRFRALRLRLKHDINFYIFLPADKPADKPASTTKRPRKSRSPESHPRFDSAHMKALVKLAGDLFNRTNFCSGCKGAKGTEGCREETHLKAALHLLDIDSASMSGGALSFPKIKFESNLSPNTALKFMGVRKAMGFKAEIGNMTEGNVYITRFKHKTMIEATELGIRAAGKTFEKLFTRSSASRRHFHVDRPFLYMIYYKELPLFVGQYVENIAQDRNPDEEED